MSNAKALPVAVAGAAKTAPRKESELRHIVRVLGMFLKGNHQPFVLGFVMLIAETLAGLADGLPLAYVLDYLTDPQKNPDLPALVRQWTGLTLPAFASPLVITVGGMAIAVIVIAMLNSLTDSLAEIYLAKGGRKLGYNMRVGLYSHLQKLSLAFYNKQRTGDLLTRVTGDVSALEDFITTSLSDIVGGLLTLVGTLIVVFYLSWQVALVALVLVPVLAWVSDYFSQQVKAASKKARAREGDLAASAQEMLTSIRVIQTYGSGSDQIAKFSKQSEKTMDSALEAAGIQARFSFTFKLLESAILAGIICLGVFLNVQNLIALGTLVFLVKKIDDMFKPTKKIIKEWNTVGKIYASVERIGELMDRQPAVENAPNAQPAPHFQGNVAFNHVSFAYMPEPEDIKDGQAVAPKLALRDVSFSIAPGEVVALVGGSGAGKSTIVQLLPRLYDPHAGALTIDGQDIRAFTLDTLRSRMSMMLQEAILFTGTVADNIAYGRPGATRDEIIAAAMQANAHDFIEKMPKGYDTELSERAGNLSGGQRQRIAIARAFIRNTPILILDEPTTGLDAESTELVLLALHELMRGKATLIISHDLNLIRQADKIIAIKEGQIVQVGTHKQLLKQGGLYADLYNRQFGQAVEELSGKVFPPTEQPVEPADEDAPLESPKIFQTLIGKALPAPASPRAFQTLMMQAVPAAVFAPAAPPVTPVTASTQPASTTPPPVQAAKPVDAMPSPGQGKTPPTIFATTVMHTIPEASAGNGDDSVPAATGPSQFHFAQPPAPSGNGHFTGAQLDLRNSPVVQSELPGLQTAFDAAAMREYLQSVLFGKPDASYRITSCKPGKAVYMGDCCVLRYEIAAQHSTNGVTIEAVVVGRVFQNQLAAAVYMRDKLAPLAALMHGREEIAPFATPVAMLEPLNMVVYVFPIDGELPTLIGATDHARMRDVFAETLPDALTDRFTPQECQMTPVNYARRYRCVMRYEIDGIGRDGHLQHRTVYGKVATDNEGALISPVIAALREYVLANRNGYRFDIPRSLGFRPDLQLALLEAIPGKPQVAQLLKARLKGEADVVSGSLTLDEAIDACAHIAAALHTSNIQLGRRRTLDSEVGVLQKEINTVKHVSPDVGAQFQTWLERITAYAEASDSLRLGFSHGDYTYSQLIFDGKQSGLVDFDTICQAEPALDLGQFLAYLKVATQKAHREASAGQSGLGRQLGERFLKTYITDSRDLLEDAERLRVRAAAYTIVSLLRMALHSWQQIKTARVENVIAVLEEEFACLPQLDY